MSNILSALQFVRGAVAKKEIVPALSHFHISNGVVTGYNGKMALSSPIPVDIDCCPKAIPFIKAIQACDETVQLHLTPTGKLSIRSGKFRSIIECFPEEFPDIKPDGIVIELPQEASLVPALKTLYPITSEDASRPWAAGVRLNGQTAFATNNVILVQYWLGFRFPYAICIPRYAVSEIIRIGIEPARLHVSGTSLTVEYPEGRWLRTQLNSADWPPAEELLGKLPPNADPIPEGFFESIELLEPFVNKMDEIHFLEGRLSTEVKDADGTTVDFTGLPPVGIYSATMLLLLKGIAEYIDFLAYPRPCVLYGPSIRGAIIGRKPV